MTFTEQDIARFHKLVEVLPCGCWYWLGARSRGQGNRKFYGTFKVNGVAIRAHRFASEALGGQKLPPGHHRDYTCNFSMCVNPNHIEVVTHEENQKRKMARRPA